jgi:tricorn protease interacting factor F2/3
MDFEGRAHIFFHAEAPVQRIELDALELAVRRCSFLGGEKPEACPFSIDPKKEVLAVELPHAASGDFEIEVEYVGAINASMAGFYRSQYTLEGRTCPLAVTQFQESDARRAFPCLDHPAHKATFEVCLVVDESLEAVSNTPARSRSPAGGGKAEVWFEKTPKMPTYLVFFGVGDFRHRPGSQDPRVRALWLPGMGEEAGYGLSFGEKALAYCEAYFGIPYPLSKLDLIAVPDFAFGAMENWGAITFRENLLLYNPEITSAEQEERICEVIAHEIVHQWFGNLVTPSDWRYLWLNESFATYFGFGVVAHYHPGWEVWEAFLSDRTAPALARDGLTDTPAIEIPGGSHVVINSSTAPVIYSKGGSILRQVEGYLGSEAFQAGLHDYLTRYAYGNAASRDLWLALENASGEPISRMMEAWVETPGHPLVTAARQESRLVLRQERFSYLARTDASIWPIPLLVRVFDEDGDSRVESAMMDAPELSIEIGGQAAAYKLNDGQTGFYRAAYEDMENLEALCGLVREEKISAVDRWGLENDLYALAKAGRRGVSDYLEFLSNFRQDRHPLVLSDIFGHLFELYRVLKEPGKEKAGALCRQWIAETADRLGVTPGAGEPHGVLRLRRQVFRMGAFLEAENVLALGAEAFEKVMKGEPVSADMRQTLLQIGAWARGDAAFDWLLRQEKAASSEQERINILTALGSFREPGLIEKALGHILEKTPDRNKFIPVVQMVQNPRAPDLLWDWYTRNQGALSGIHPLIHERIIGAIVPVCGLDRLDSVRSYLESHFADTDPIAPVLRMVLERLAINQRLRDKEG